jgi:uncharacterized membrane protein
MTMAYIAAYLAALLAFGILDAGWLTIMGPKLYKPEIGSLLSAKVQIAPAVLFYLIYIGGVIALAAAPAAKSGGVSKAAIAGGILGFVAYATYDLTNAATLKVWSWKITAADMGWGLFITAVAAAVGCFVLQRMTR